jgi:hypothetical protein
MKALFVFVDIGGIVDHHCLNFFHNFHETFITHYLVVFKILTFEVKKGLYFVLQYSRMTL